jgi:hypothetical protein
MALRVASMVGDAPAVDCELMAAAETWSHDTKLSRSDPTVAQGCWWESHDKGCINQVTGLGPGPLRRGGTVAATH